MYSRIAGTGKYLPERVLTNLDLEKMVDTSDEWIRSRTGIERRHIAADEQATSDLASEAARIAIEDAGLSPGDIEMIVVGTTTPDLIFPNVACIVQERLGIPAVPAFSVEAACSGFVYALSVADQFIRGDQVGRALVIGAETMSRIIDWTDRETCVLFGDGAGAAVLKPANGSGRGILSSHLRSDGNLAELLYRPGGGAIDPISQSMLDEGRHLLKMQGREIFKNAVRSMAEACDFALKTAGMTADDIDLLVPHQANIRIIEATAKYAGIPMEKVFVNVNRYGNMSSASVPIALDEAQEQGVIGPGSNVLTVAFGAGLTWGAMALRL
jgi:3-oxoacyl-[acyl-carrier-protein] synthase-3